MKRAKENQYLRTLSMPFFDAYPVDDFINAMTLSIRRTCINCKNLTESTGDDTICPGCMDTLNNHKKYLVSRLIEAISNEKIKVWNWQLEKSQDKKTCTFAEYPLWANLDYIIRQGLRTRTS